MWKGGVVNEGTRVWHVPSHLSQKLHSTENSCIGAVFNILYPETRLIVEGRQGDH